MARPPNAVYGVVALECCDWPAVHSELATSLISSQTKRSITTQPLPSPFSCSSRPLYRVYPPVFHLLSHLTPYYRHICHLRRLHPSPRSPPVAPSLSPPNGPHNEATIPSFHNTPHHHPLLRELKLIAPALTSLNTTSLSLLNPPDLVIVLVSRRSPVSAHHCYTLYRSPTRHHTVISLQ